MPEVVAVNKSPAHTLTKQSEGEIRLLKDLGVEGDAHMGKTVKHRSRVAKDPTQPNLRQVHLIHSELFDELRSKGFSVKAGQMGENITTRGIDLLGLPRHTILTLGDTAEIQITGLRNPCAQLDGIQKGLMKAVLEKDTEGNLIRKAGIMAIVIKGGKVQPGAQIHIQLPEEPHEKLEKV